MKQPSKKPETSVPDTQIESKFDLDSLLHPARAFAHPSEVVCDPDLTLNEKRAILASWASDACAVEAAPGLRTTAQGNMVRWDDIMDALRLLDHEAACYKAPPHYKRVLAMRRGGVLGTKSSRREPGDGPPLN